MPVIILRAWDASGIKQRHFPHGVRVGQMGDKL